MKESIQRRAKELGFDSCRITTAEAPASGEHFRQWLAEGKHGKMGYLARNATKRMDPQQVLAGAQSIIVLTASYAAGQDAGAPAFTGQIARYARRADYHDLLAGPLKELTEFVDAMGGAGTASLWYVDTGPLLERDFAHRAGAGFIGKHTNLVSRTTGNWILLSEIITTLRLDPDPAEKNRCGSCTRCIAACPTSAIAAPFQLDARRCISYLTIELKESIPLEFRPAIGNRIFGCDDCLAACPWNRFAAQASLLAGSRNDLAMPNLLDLLKLDEAGFRRRFARTPIARAKRRGFLRNVCVALGNIGDASVVPALEAAARDPEPLIAEHAAWAIERVVSRMALGARPDPAAGQERLAGSA